MYGFLVMLKLSDEQEHRYRNIRKGGNLPVKQENSCQGAFLDIKHKFLGGFLYD
jgi:hypothetical protein